MGVFIGGLMVFKRRVKDIETLDLIEKLQKYREAMIVRTAAIEGPDLFFNEGFILFGSEVFLIEAFAGLILLAFFFPTNFRNA